MDVAQDKIHRHTHKYYVYLWGDEMEIYVVKQGDTVTSIANRFDVPAAEIEVLNGIENRGLAVGEALLIPLVGQNYTVQAGDSLYKIAMANGLTVNEIAQVNQISPDKQLQIGETLYIPPRKKLYKDAAAYIQPTATTYKESIVNDMQQAAPLLTYSAIFAFEIDANGNLKEPPLEPILSIAKENQVVSMLVVNNIRNGNFSSSLASRVVHDAAFQKKVIDSIFAYAEKYRLADIHIDFENIEANDKEAYNQFLRNIKARLPRGYTLSVSLVPKTSSKQPGKTYTAHDYKVQGEIADFVIIMTYDWGWQGGPPMAVSPINEVEKVINYAISEMPASKIMMGQNLYGFDWKIPFQQGTNARALSAKQAVQLAVRWGAIIQYDKKAQAPYFKYTDENGQNHEVWFEDARSIQAKFDLIRRKYLRGIAYWKLGLPFPQNWALLRENFRINKR